MQKIKIAAYDIPCDSPESMELWNAPNNSVDLNSTDVF